MSEFPSGGVGVGVNVFVYMHSMYKKVCPEGGWKKWILCEGGAEEEVKIALSPSFGPPRWSDLPVLFFLLFFLFIGADRLKLPILARILLVFT